MMKYKALVTAELVREMLGPLADRIDFEFAGYAIDHEVMPREELRRRVADVEVLVCEYDTIDAEIFEAAKQLKIIICCRGGVKSVIDLDCAMRQGVIVCNNLGRNAAAVSELVMAFLLDLARNVTKTTNLIHDRVITTDVRSKPDEYRDTVWGLDNNSPFIRFRGRSLAHMTLGIVGYGSAGRQVAQEASAFGMTIIAYDPYIDPAKVPEGVRLVHLDELLASADAVTLHCIATPQTRGMFNATTFAKMKKSAFFVNTSRGELAVKNHYYNAGDNVPCSVDAVTFERDGVYLVEFKCGDADKAQLYRKIYDSIMLLIEFDNYTFKKARAEIVYIVVSAKLQPWTAQQKSLSRAFGFCRNPWEKYRQKYDNWNLAPFEGVVVKSVYTMPPDMFDFFAKYKSGSKNILFISPENVL